MFKRLVLILVLLSMAIPSYATQWEKDKPDGATQYVDEYDDEVQENQGCLDRLLSNYRSGCEVRENSSSSFDVDSGEITLSNSDGSIRLLCKNTSTTTTSPTISASTTYYIYAVQSVATDEDFDIEVTTNATTPTTTYFKLIGKFETDGSSNIDKLGNITSVGKLFNYWESRSASTIYQADNDGLFIVTGVCGNGDSIEIYSDANASPSTLRARGGVYQGEGNSRWTQLTVPVRRNDYYKCVIDDSTDSTIFWVSQS